MNTNTLFPQYANAISNLDINSIRDVKSIPQSLLLAQDGKISVHYIPFEHVNSKAKIVLVGITPGFTQFINAMREAQKQLRSGADQETALRAAKQTGAFSGSMRPNLVAMLDYLGISRWLGIQSCNALFDHASGLVQTTSVLRHPVFVDGDNYNGTPNMTKHPLLRRVLVEHFSKEAAQLKNAIFVPLGPKVSEALAWMTAEGAIDGSRVLDGMPHPSGANAERIAYFLGRKARNQLSTKTNADKLDKAVAGLMEKMAAIGKAA